MHHDVSLVVRARQSALSHCPNLLRHQTSLSLPHQPVDFSLATDTIDQGVFLFSTDILDMSLYFVVWPKLIMSVM